MQGVGEATRSARSLGVSNFAAAVLAALLPFWAPLVASLTTTLNLLILGLFMRAVLRAVGRQSPTPQPPVDSNAPTKQP